ncbi:MAG: CDP-archaeol synthase [SAR202 cluster bacterium]|nr:CDP-archaeol synthase [SAR202 cluster bacterium]
MLTRIISAAFGISIVLIAIWIGFPGVAVLAVLAGFIGGYELNRLARPSARISDGTRMISLVAGPVVLASVGVWLATDGRINGGLMPILVAIIFALTVLLRGLATLGKSSDVESWAYWVFAAYTGVALAHAPVLIELERGRELVLFILLTTFSIDTMALFVGLLIGRHRLAPSISPKKSWEGAFAGLLGGVAMAITVDLVLNIHFTLMMAGLLGGILGVTAIFGDLYESWVKRKAGVKDSGTIIPGHGGILDRLDSVIPNLMIVYWVAVWVTL